MTPVDVGVVVAVVVAVAVAVVVVVVVVVAVGGLGRGSRAGVVDAVGEALDADAVALVAATGVASAEVAADALGAMPIGGALVAATLTLDDAGGGDDAVTGGGIVACLTATNAMMSNVTATIAITIGFDVRRSIADVGRGVAFSTTAADVRRATRSARSDDAESTPALLPSAASVVSLGRESIRSARGTCGFDGPAAIIRAIRVTSDCVSSGANTRKLSASSATVPKRAAGSF